MKLADMIGGVYKITNLINNKIYIGSSNDINERVRIHKVLLNTQNHHNLHLQRAYNKYGKDNFKFEFLEEFELPKNISKKDQDLIFKSREQFFLNSLLQADVNNKYFKKYGYNISRLAFPNFTGEVKKGKDHPKHKKISVFDLNMNFIEEVFGVKETARKYNTYHQSITNCAKGITGKSKGYIFRYSDNLDVTYIKRLNGLPKGFETHSAVIMFKYNSDNSINTLAEYNNLTEAKRQTKIDPRTIKDKCINGTAYKNEIYFKFKNKLL